MNAVENITPYGTRGDSRHKSEQVRDMFDNIARDYDRMNRLMTLGIDRRWRCRAVEAVTSVNPRSVLDIAAGTADLTIALAEAMPQAAITGVDLSEGMLRIGRKKIADKGLDSRVTLKAADALALPFGDAAFDALTIAFGVRNFEHLEKGYAEMARVLRPGGRLVVLELTPPARKAVKPFYSLYTRGVIPMVGKLMSGDSRAYTYLPETIAAVPARDAMTRLMTEAGFTDASWKSLTFGVATIYIATR